MKKAQSKLLASRVWPVEFAAKVDMTRISMESVRPWVESRITQLLGDEDEIVHEYCIAQLEDFDLVDKSIDPRMVQINLEGFLGVQNAQIFMQELWNFLLDAQMKPLNVVHQKIEEKSSEADRLKQEMFRRREDEKRDQKTRDRGKRESPRRRSEDDRADTLRKHDENRIRQRQDSPRIRRRDSSREGRTRHGERTRDRRESPPGRRRESPRRRDSPPRRRRSRSGRRYLFVLCLLQSYKKLSLSMRVLGGFVHFFVVF